MSEPVKPNPMPNSEWIYATKPTRFTLFFRTFLPWQAWRFVWINVKMMKIIGRGHGHYRSSYA